MPTHAADTGTAATGGAATTRSDERPTVVVVGGGIAGLSAAWGLTAAGGVRVVVLEASARPGGKLRTDDFGDRPVDLGPDAFVTRRNEATALCGELGLADDLVAPGASGASVWARGRLRPLPAGLALGVPTELAALARSGVLGPIGLGRAAADLLRPPGRGAEGEGDHSVGDLVGRRLGRAVVELLADPLIGGITAGPVDTMSAAAVFPPLLDAARRGGSLMRGLRPRPHDVPGTRPDDPQPPPMFLTVRGGMGHLAARLADRLRERGAELHLSAPVAGLRAVEGRWAVDMAATSTTARITHAGDTTDAGGTSEIGGTLEADAVVVATPAPHAAALLVAALPGLSAGLRGIQQASVSVVTIEVDEDDVPGPLTGTGFLVPAVQGLLVTGCTYLSSKWPALKRPGRVLLRASCGRAGDDRAARMPDDEVVRRVVEDLTAVLGLRAAPMEATVTRWVDAFPQYRLGHLDLVDSLFAAAAAAPAPLALAGSTYAGVGIPACIGSGQRAARAVLDRLSSAPTR